MLATCHPGPEFILFARSPASRRLRKMMADKELLIYAHFRESAELVVQTKHEGAGYRFPRWISWVRIPSPAFDRTAELFAGFAQEGPDAVFGHPQVVADFSVGFAFDMEHANGGRFVGRQFV